ncbi:MAG: hypothetical protein R3C27_11885 [Hyphomonadaceae bacterium]
MSRTLPPPRSGLTGLLFVFCLTALLVGLGFDLMGGARVRFWIGDQPAAAAAVGIAGVLFVIIAAQLMRLVLGRRAGRDEEGSDAGSHP